jgi:hypothetical protein
MSSEKLEKVVELVQEYVDMNESQIEDFMDGGDEGWDCGDDEQQEWLGSASADEIADWVIAGNR